MRNILDALWRAVVYCVQPAVILLSLAPLIVVLLAVFAFAYWGWQPAVDAMQAWLQGGMLEAGTLRLMQWLGLAGQPRFLPVLLVLCLAIPALVMGSLLIVTWLSTPALVRLLALRRFPTLEKKHGGNILASAFWSIGYTVLALCALLVSLPLWLLPPLALLIPPLIWGWLVAKLLPYDVLADHASADERRTLFRRHRLELLVMGIITGLLGSAPSLLFASGVITVALFIVLAPLAIWLYTLIFVFSTLWFGHFCLHALEQLRAENPVLDAHATVLHADTADRGSSHTVTAAQTTEPTRPLPHIPSAPSANDEHQSDAP